MCRSWNMLWSARENGPLAGSLSVIGCLRQVAPLFVPHYLSYSRAKKATALCARAGWPVTRDNPPLCPLRAA